MTRIITTSKFERDLKYYKKKHVDLSSLEELIDCFEFELDIPAKFKLHRLKGDMAGYMECHIKDDILLLYIDGNDSVTLLRLASHDDLFK